MLYGENRVLEKDVNFSNTSKEILKLLHNFKLFKNLNLLYISDFLPQIYFEFIFFLMF